MARRANQSTPVHRTKGNRSRHLARAREVFEVEMAALRAVRDQLDDAFHRAVELLVTTLRERGKIIVVGIGKSGNVGQKIAATLTSTGSTSVVLNAVDALHGDLGIVNDGDVVLDVDAALNRLPSHAPVHRAGIDVVVPQLARDQPRHRALAAGGRTIDCDDCDRFVH